MEVATTTQTLVLGFGAGAGAGQGPSGSVHLEGAGVHGNRPIQPRDRRLVPAPCEEKAVGGGGMLP